MAYLAISWFLFWIILVITIGVGWVMNIVDLINAASAGADFTLFLALRIAGIFVPPLGAILGIGW